MIVCSCNVIREKEIREAALSGHTDPVSAYASMGCAPRCGGCLPLAEHLLLDEVARATPIAA